MYKLAFTGHRPHKIPNYNFNDLVDIAYDILEKQEHLHKRIIVISGMANGWDLAAAHAAIQKGFPIHSYIPYPNQPKSWNYTDQLLWTEAYNQASDNGQIVICSDNPYHVSKLHKRNQMMVNACDCLVALWNGHDSGGTYSTIQYAADKQKRVEFCSYDW